MDNRRCVVAGAAKITKYKEIKKYLRRDDFFIYCDAGLSHEEKLAHRADMIVGDFDSSENPLRPTETIVLPHIKDETDTLFAVKEAMRRGFRDFLLVGVIGGRLDHTLGNIAVLNMLASEGCTALAVDDYSEVSVVTDKAEVSCDFSYFSLLNVTGVCRGVSIKNALYPLDRAELTTEFPLGISNEPLPGKTALITVGEGRALLIKVRRN